MSEIVAGYIGECQWGTASYLIFSDNVFGQLIYYSHLLPLAASLLLAVFVITNGYKSNSARALFLSIVGINLWLLFDLILWATEKPAYTMFFWSLINMVEPMIYAGILFFLYFFVDNKAPSFRSSFIIIVLLLPVVVLTPTSLALVGFDLTNCNREAIEGPMVYYGYIAEVLITLWILGFGIRRFLRKELRNRRWEIALVVSGSIFLLLSFAVGNVIGSLFVDWTIGQYGLFGIPIFVAFLGYLIVRYKAFNIKLISTQALVAALWLLTLAILFLHSVDYIRVVVGITLILFTVLGAQLIVSVRREVEQRERIEILAKNLEVSNKQQVVLIHFITHQIKGFVSKSRNIFSMILDGDFGPVPETMRPMVQEGFNSDTKGANTIQEILNAANIKSGKVTYANNAFDLKELVNEIIKDLKPLADAKHLELTLTAPEDSYTVNGDRMQLLNAFKNLIDNSIKYTITGTVAISLTKSADKIHFEIKDTGVGITAEDMAHLFTEGGHGKESQKINVDSTGFGLYIVKNIIEAHKGKVWAESEGKGKGSRFIVELPV